MDWSETVVQCLKGNNIKVVPYVPDAITWRVLEKLEKDPFFHTVPCTREDEAMGVACGAYLGKQRAAVFMQSSGLGNCINALGSLSVPCRIPFPLFVSMRGDLWEFNIVQVPVGRAVRPILESLGMQHVTLTRADEVEGMVNGAIKLCYASRVPVGILFSTLLTGGKRVD